MAVKRKFIADSDDVTALSAKQLKLVPFPHYEPDLDVSMAVDDAPTSASSSFLHHTRQTSNVSSIASSASSSSPNSTYPHLQPNQENATQDHDMQVLTLDGSTPPLIKVGLLQPSAGFQHHGSQCSQVPKLRVACASGVNGTRSMWSFCEQCGAISMVDSD
ncbi:hypothetical protein BDV98DRAFT_41624 [Pterulicium gracile]|uniref:Uncharacterized protein n=1 Tax=Pterulicium gracile TaxID=1884261 RepID=A0A5C3R0U5_9AGAR|nr:hypothetical protein BDV98DRAFT_41624 [Pterula gracilis]